MSRKESRLAIVLALLSLFFFYLEAGPASRDDHSAEGAEAIRAQELLREVRILAAPEMEGRESGTRGGARAAAHIAEEFRTIGLKPLPDGGHLQAFEVTTGLKLGGKNELVVEQSHERKLYQAGVSFNPFGFSDEGSLSKEVVFAGYGISAPELGYDDYAGIEVRDRIVLVMTHEPQEKNPHGPFRKPEAFRYTEIRYKIINAREHGARGILVVTDPNNHKGENLFALRGGRSVSAGILALNVSREVAEKLVSPSGKSLSQLQKEIDQTLEPRSFPASGVMAHLHVSLSREKGRAANVIGIVPGQDPGLREEAILIGAHYDGLGRGGENSLAPDRYGEIHPGADDNASGVAGLLALSRAFIRDRPRRSLVFVAFAAEEMGLLGSSHYVKNPAWPIAKTYAMINLDGIGRLEDDRVYILGVDTAQEFRPLLRQAAGEINLQLRMSGSGFGPSDHTPFYAKGKPVLMFFTGPHSDYHRPSDSADKINGQGLEKVAHLAFRTVAALADRTEPLTFVKAEEESPRTSREGRSGYGVYFGSIPDFSESAAPGVRLSGVRPGSPAEKAGLKTGDTIVQFSGVTIRNLDDLVFALRSNRPGDRVEVVYLREGKELKSEATLEERR